LRPAAPRGGVKTKNLFTETLFKNGGITADKADIREFAYLRKLEGILWGAQDDCDFQVDWLGQDGAYMFDEQGPRREMLVNYYADMLMLTGQKIAIEYKPGDPAIFMTESDVEACVSICEDVENLVYQRIREQVVIEMGVKAPWADVETKTAEIFSQFAGNMGINIEDAHVYLKNGQTVANAVERAIKAPMIGAYTSNVAILKNAGMDVSKSVAAIEAYKGRLFHRHPNDAYVANGDPDLIPGTVHENDLILSCYQEQKTGVDQGITYEPDLFAVRGDPLANWVESINRVNYAHAVASNLLQIEREELGGESIVNRTPTEQSVYMRRAKEMPLNYKEIDVGIAAEYRKEIGKPMTYTVGPFENGPLMPNGAQGTTGLENPLATTRDPGVARLAANMISAMATQQHQQS